MNNSQLVFIYNPHGVRMSHSEESVLDKSEKVKERFEMLKDDLWNVEALYSSWEAWQKDLEIWARPMQKPHWPEFDQFKGAIQDPKILVQLLKLSFEIDRQLSKLYTYAHLRHDEDVACEVPSTNYTRMVSYLYSFREELSWVEPELLHLDSAVLDRLLNCAELAEYKVYLEKILRFKPHTLSSDMERLMALSGKALETAQRAFSVFSNADIQFPLAEDSKGNKKELSHGKYHLYMRSADRVLRKTAFTGLHSAFLGFENTLCELIQGQIQKHVFEKRARGYSSCLQAALFPHQVDEKVYTSLISSVHQNLPSLHRYAQVRKKLLKVDELHMYDIYAPIVSDVNFSMDYSQAQKLVIESVHPLGQEYQQILRKGLTEDRWVDRYENARKRSGAYSSGCYDSSPYILMNFQGTLSDVLTLTHEAGHSMHTYMSSKHQPYQYAQYPIFLAEVASTFHEELLLRHLMSKASSVEEKAYLINQKIDDIRATFFRQTLFAEFELKMHQLVEADIPLTPSLLKEEYRALNQKYYGSDLIIDQETDIEWARIPHFYYNFYVYQYATGLSASVALVEQVINEGESAKERYLKFLSSGCSKYPLETLAIAGVDMRGPEVVNALIRRFNQLVNELEILLS